MSNLELSKHAELYFASLKNFFPGSKLIDGDLDLQLECEHIVIVIRQVDRYEANVSFYIGLRGEKVFFTFRDMAYALVENSTLAALKNLEEIPVRSRNNLEAERFIQFCVAYKAQLQEWPPA